MHTTRSFLAIALTALAGAPAIAAVAGPRPPDAPQPAGPHLILVVPVELRILPPEVTQYTVQCVTDPAVLPGLRAGASTGTVKARPDADIAAGRVAISADGSGHGHATGAIPAGSGGLGTEVSVGIFLDKGPMDFSQRLSRVTTYECELILKGTAYEVTTEYLNASTEIPVAKGAAYKRFITGTLPK